MHDLDEARRERHLARQAALGERTFIFGGEQFIHVTDCPYDVVKQAAMIEDMSGVEVFFAMENCVVRLIEPGTALPQTDEDKALGEPVLYSDHERFRALLHRTDDPITSDDVSHLLRWLMGATTGRPTQPSAASATGSAESGTNSTVGSSQLPVEASRV